MPSQPRMPLARATRCQSTTVRFGTLPLEPSQQVVEPGRPGVEPGAAGQVQVDPQHRARSARAGRAACAPGARWSACVSHEMSLVPRATMTCLGSWPQLARPHHLVDPPVEATRSPAAEGRRPAVAAHALRRQRAGLAGQGVADDQDPASAARHPGAALPRPHGPRTGVPRRVRGPPAVHPIGHRRRRGCCRGDVGRRSRCGGGVTGSGTGISGIARGRHEQRRAPGVPTPPASTSRRARRDPTPIRVPRSMGPV